MSAEKDVQVVVSADRLKAWLRIHPQLAPQGIGRDRLDAALDVSRVARTAAVESRLHELHQMLQSGSLPGQDFLLVEYPPPGEPVDARFEWAESLRPAREGQDDAAERVNHYDRRQIVSARAGQVIGTIEPAQPGGATVDVYGNPVAPARTPASIGLRGNVRMAPDGRSVVAACDGRVIFEDNKLSIASVLEVPGDVDFGTGNIDSPGDVVIGGSVKDLFQVRGSRDVTVEGHVDSAQLEAGDSIHIRGGIHGHGKASIHAGGCVETKLCDGATIEAGGTFSVQRECLNCRVHAARMVAPAGTIIGGYVWARDGIEVQTLGSGAHVRTAVSTGVPVRVMEEALGLAAQAKDRRDAARKIRETIEPLLREMRRLSPPQRERATELMFQADQLEQDARQLDARREQMLAQAAPQCEPSVLVGGRIHPGVTVIVSGRATTIQADLRGPVRILERKIDGVTTLAAVDTISGSLRPLKTERFTAQAEAQVLKAGEPSLAATTAAAPTAAQ